MTEWKTIRLTKENYIALLKTKAIMEIEEGVTYSFNDAIGQLLENAPQIESVELRIEE